MTEMLSPISVKEPRRADDTRGFYNIKLNDYLKTIQYANQTIELTKKQLQKKKKIDILSISDITEQEDIDIQDKFVKYRQLQFNFKAKSNISALVSGIPAPPDPPSRHLEKLVAITQNDMREAEIDLEKLKQLDEKYFEQYKQREEKRKQFMRFEAHAKNICVSFGGTLLLAGTLYVVGPYALSWFLNNLGTSASGLATASRAAQAATKLRGDVEGAFAAVGPLLDKFTPPSAEDIAKFIQEHPGINETDALGQMKKMFMVDNLISTGKYQTINEASTAFDLTLRYQSDMGASLRTAEEAALGALKKIEKSLVIGNDWKTTGLKFISEVFFGLTPYQMGQVENMINAIQSNTLLLIKSDPNFAKNPSAIFDLAFNGKNPLLGNLSAEDLTAESLRIKFKNEKGFDVENMFVKKYQSSVIDLTNFMIDRAVGPLAGYFLRFDANLLKPTDPSNFLTDTTKLVNQLLEDPDWKPNLLEKGALELFGLFTSVNSSQTLSLIQFYKSAKHKKDTLQAIAEQYKTYKREIDNVLALFWPPENVQPEIQEPFMRTMWSRVKNSIVLRNEFKNYWIRSFGYDKQLLAQATATAAAADDENTRLNQQEPPSSIDNENHQQSDNRGLEEEEEAKPFGPEPKPFGPEPKPEERPLEVEEEEEEKEEEEKEEEQAPISDIDPNKPKGVIQSTIHFFKLSVKNTFSPENLIGYASNCMYDSIANMVTVEVEKHFPKQFKKMEEEDSEEKKEKERKKQEAYQEGLQKMRIMYIEKGYQGDELVRLMRDQAMMTNPDGTMDAENLNVLEFTFKKIQLQAGELYKKGLGGDTYFYWGSGILISLVNELLSFHKPIAQGDGGFQDNSSVVHLNYYGLVCKPYADMLITYLQSQVSTKLAQLTTDFQAAYRKIFDDVYENYVRKPMLNSRIIKYINQNIRKKFTDVTSRVFKRIYLGLFISKVLNRVIDLFFDTITQMSVNLTLQQITEFQNYLYLNYKDVTIGGIQPFDLTKYTLPTGWDSVMKLFEGKSLIQFWNTMNANLAESGLVSSKTKLRYLLSNSGEGITNDLYSVYYEEGYENLEELLGKKVENKYVSQEEKLLYHQRRIVGFERPQITQAKVEKYLSEHPSATTREAAEAVSNDNMEDIYNEYSQELQSQMEMFFSKYKDTTLDPVERAYCFGRYKMLVALLIACEKEKSLLKDPTYRKEPYEPPKLDDVKEYLRTHPGSSTSEAASFYSDKQRNRWPETIKKQMNYKDLPPKTQALLLDTLKVPPETLQGILDGFDLNELKFKDGKPLLDIVTKIFERSIIDTIYSMTSFFTGKRNREKATVLKMAPNMSITLEGDAMKTFNQKEKRTRFLEFVSERMISEHYGDKKFTDEQQKNYIKEKIREFGYFVTEDELTGLISDIQVRYNKIVSKIYVNQLTLEQIRDFCLELRREDAQNLVDEYMRTHIPEFLLDASRAAKSSVLGETPPRKSIKEFKYIKVGNEYFKVEEFNKEITQENIEKYLSKNPGKSTSEAASAVSEQKKAFFKSDDPIERYLGVQMTPISSNEIPPEDFKRIHSQSNLQFDTLPNFQNALVKYLLDKHVSVFDSQGLYILNTVESFGLYKNIFTTIPEFATTVQAKKYSADAISMLMQLSGDGLSINRDHELYKRLSNEMIINEVFSTNIITYMSIPAQMKLIDEEIESTINSWDNEKRKNAHLARMRDYLSGKTGLVDTDLLPLLEAKESLEKSRQDSINAAINSLSQSLQDQLRYNRKKALSEYITRIDDLIKKIKTKDLKDLDSMAECNPTTQDTTDIKNFEEALNDINSFDMKLAPTAMKFEKADTVGLDKQLENLKQGCIPPADLAIIRKNLNDTIKEANNRKKTLIDIARSETGSLDLRSLFDFIREIEENRKQAAMDIPYFTSMNSNYQQAKEVMRSKLPSLLESRGRILGIYARRRDREVMRISKENYDKLKSQTDNLPKELKATLELSPTGVPTFVQKFEDLRKTCETILGQNSYVPLPGEDPSVFMNRMLTLFQESNNRLSSLADYARNASLELLNLSTGPKAFATALRYLEENFDSYKLNDIPDYRTDYKNSPLVKTQKVTMESLFNESDALRNRLSKYRTNWSQIEPLFTKYKGRTFGAVLLPSEEEDFKLLKQYLTEIQKDNTLKSNLTTFETTSVATINKAEKDHRDYVKTTLTEIQNKLPNVEELNTNIARVTNLINGYKASSTGTVGAYKVTRLLKRLENELDSLEALRADVLELHLGINNGLRENQNSIIDITKLQQKWNGKLRPTTKQISDYMKENPNKSTSEVASDVLKNNPSLQSATQTYLTDTGREERYKNWEKSVQKLMRGKYSQLEALINTHLDAAKLALKNKWQPLYDFYAQKYGTPRGPTADPKDPPFGEPIPKEGVTLPDRAEEIVLKARAFLNIGTLDERYPDYNSIYSYILPVLDTDDSNIIGNIASLNILQGIQTNVANLVSDYEFEYTLAQSHVDFREAFAIIKNLNKNLIPAYEQTIEGERQTLEEEKENLLEKINGLSSKNKVTYTSEFTAIQSGLDLIKETNQFLKQGKDKTGKVLTGAEINQIAKELKTQKEKLQNRYEELVGSTNRLHNEELITFIGQMKPLYTRYKGLRDKLQDIEEMLKDEKKEKTDTEYLYLRSKLTALETCCINKYEDFTVRVRTLSTPAEIESWINSVTSQLNDLEKGKPVTGAQVEEFLRTHPNKTTSNATTLVNVTIPGKYEKTLEQNFEYQKKLVLEKKQRVLSRYDEILSTAESNLALYEQKFASIEASYMRSPNDSRLRALYTRASLLRQNAKNFVGRMKGGYTDFLLDLRGGKNKKGETVLSRPDPTDFNEIYNMSDFLDAFDLGINLDMPNMPNYTGDFGIFDNIGRRAETYKQEALTKLKSRLDDSKDLVQKIDDVRVKINGYNKCTAKQRLLRTCPFEAPTTAEQAIYDEVKETTPVDKYKYLTNKRNREQQLWDMLSNPKKTKEEIDTFLTSNPELFAMLGEISAEAEAEAEISQDELNELKDFLKIKVATTKKTDNELINKLNSIMYFGTINSKGRRTADSMKPITDEEITEYLKQHPSATRSEAQTALTEERNRQITQLKEYMRLNNEFKTLYESNLRLLTMKNINSIGESSTLKNRFTLQNLHALRELYVQSIAEQVQEAEQEEQRQEEAQREDEALATEEAPPTSEEEEEGEFQPGDKDFILFSNLAPILRSTFNKYHKAKGNMALIDTYDFSFCKNKESDKLNQEVSNTDFEKYLLRELVIDNFFDHKEQNEAPAFDSPEGELLRKTARDCINALEEKAAVTCEGIKKEYWEDIKQTYQDALNGENNFQILAAYTTASMFETFEKGSKAKLYIKGIPEPDLLSGPEGIFKVSPERAKDLDSRFQFFVQRKGEKDPKAKATNIAARVAWVSHRISELSKKAMNASAGYLFNELTSALQWLGRHAYSTFKSVANYILPTIEEVLAEGEVNIINMIDLGPSQMMKDIGLVMGKIYNYFNLPEQIVNLGNLRGAPRGTFGGTNPYRRSADYIRGTTKGLTGFQKDFKMVKDFLWRDPRFILQDTWRGVKNTAWKAWGYGKQKVKEAYGAVTNWDNWKKGFKALTSLDTYKNFIKANPDLVLSLSISLGIAIGARFNKKENHYHVWGTNIGFGFWGTVGGAVGLGVGVAVLAAFGAPVTVVGAVGVLAASAVSWFVFTAIDKIFARELQESSESDEDYYRRIRAVSEEAVLQWTGAANAQDIRKFLKGSQKLNDNYTYVHKSLRDRIQRIYNNDKDFRQYIDGIHKKQIGVVFDSKHPILVPSTNSSGKKIKTISDDYYKGLTESQVDELFRKVLTYEVTKNPKETPKEAPKEASSSSSEPKKGGSNEVYRTTPLFDFLDSILLLMTMNNVKYLRLGYSFEAVQEITLIEYLSAVMPLLHDLLSFELTEENRYEQLLLSVQLPYAFLAFEPAVALDIPTLVEGIYDGHYIKRPLSNEELQNLITQPTIFIESLQENSPV